jgi:hypothetical protein
MDSWICQTSTASPAEPGGLSLWAGSSRAEGVKFGGEPSPAGSGERICLSGAQESKSEES